MDTDQIYNDHSHEDLIASSVRTRGHVKEEPIDLDADEEFVVYRYGHHCSICRSKGHNRRTCQKARIQQDDGNEGVLNNNSDIKNRELFPTLVNGKIANAEEVWKNNVSLGVKRINKCSRCKKYAHHNKQTCTAIIVARSIRCSICRRCTGHNKKTCPEGRSDGI